MPNYKDHGGAGNTAGPWLRMATGTRRGSYSISDEGGRSVAAISGNINRPGVEKLANAVLIQNAPAMRALLAELCEWDSKDTRHDAIWVEVRALLHNMRDEGA